MRNLDLLFKKVAKTIDPKIKEILDSYVDKKNQKLVQYQISTGGKRLRPALAIISCKMLGGKLKDVLYPAAGLEILHNYSLIVDDIIDHGVLRRDKPTTWAKFGKSIAECIATDHAAAIFQTANKIQKNSAKISELFSQALKTIFDGEILDILFKQRGREEEPYVIKNRYFKITEKDYFEMAGRKTAALFQTSCQIGGICAGAKEKEIEVLRKYGLNLGMAFQIRDDILDIFGNEDKFGKKIGKDIEERKLGNIVILFSLKELLKKEKENILKIMRKEKIKNKDIKEAIKLIKKTNSHQKANLLGKSFVEKAKKSLNFLPQNKWKEILGEIADFAIEREK